MKQLISTAASFVMCFPLFAEFKIEPFRDEHILLEISDIQIKTSGQLVLGKWKAKVTNNSKLVTKELNYELCLRDKKGFTLSVANEWINDPIQPGESISKTGFSSRLIDTNEIDIIYVRNSTHETELTEKDRIAVEAEHQRNREALIEKQPIRFRKAIRSSKIMLGMNSTQVTLSWGKPVSINKSVSKNLISEQWVFNSSAYVYFSNGKVTSWQTTE